jgi:hypothetical protein
MVSPKSYYLSWTLISFQKQGTAALRCRDRRQPKVLSRWILTRNDGELLSPLFSVYHSLSIIALYLPLYLHDSSRLRPVPPAYAIRLLLHALSYMIFLNYAEYIWSHFIWCES